MLGSSIRNRLAARGEAVDTAKVPIRTAANLLGLLASIIALEAIAILALALARVGNGASVAIVGVDATQHATVDGDGALDDHVSRAAVALAVAAAAHQLAVVLGVEVGDLDGAAAVELDDLVRGVEGAAALDEGGARGLLERDGVLADVLEPDVDEGAGALAVHALGLAGADDDVGEGGAVLEDEHGVLFTGLGLVFADGGWRFRVSMGWLVNGVGGKGLRDRS